LHGSAPREAGRSLGFTNGTDLLPRRKRLNWLRAGSERFRETCGRRTSSLPTWDEFKKPCHIAPYQLMAKSRRVRREGFPIPRDRKRQQMYERAASLGNAPPLPPTRKHRQATAPAPPQPKRWPADIPANHTKSLPDDHTDARARWSNAAFKTGARSRKGAVTFDGPVMAEGTGGASIDSTGKIAGTERRGGDDPHRYRAPFGSVTARRSGRQR